MLSFTSDYIAGAHPALLKKLIETNLENLSGYGTDKYCESAKEKIKEACGNPKADVFFLVGGTQTNQVVLDTVLKPYEGVIAAKTGHVSTHEAGAIEYTGHKVLEIESDSGKLTANAVDEYVKRFYTNESYEHMVFPGAVYISFPTEYGTLYTKKELQDLSEVCLKHQLMLYIDGARLGYGLMSNQCDVTLQDIAELSSVFYIGGTKAGALCGEAVVFTKNNTPKYFMTQVKQHGAMLAKGRVLGVQFDTLFSDNLYFCIGKHAIDMAEKLKVLFASKGYEFFVESPTNQLFVILENKKMEELREHVEFCYWEDVDENHTVVRFATSWSTTEQDIKELEKYL